MPLPAAHAIGTVPDFGVIGTSRDNGADHATSQDTIPGDLLNQFSSDVIALYAVALKTGAVLVTCLPGSDIPAGPVSITSFDGTRFVVATADADNGPAHLLLLSGIADGANGVAYLSGEFTSNLNLLAGNVGDPVYLASGGGMTLAAPTGAAQVAQIVGRIKTAVNNGVVAGCILPASQIGMSSLQHLSITTAKLAAAAVSTDKLAAGVLQAGKNKIINGTFRQWQRATSGTTGYVADRWTTANNGSTTAIARQSFTLGQTDVPGEPAYFHREVVTSSAGAGNYVVLSHKIEGVRTLAGQTAILSFYAKADAARPIAVETVQDFGTGGTPSGAVTAIAVGKPMLSTGWVKYTVALSVPWITGKTLGTDGNDCLRINFWLDAGSDFNARTSSLGQQSGTFDLALVQLETGSVATAFEWPGLSAELLACQRYCYAIATTGVLEAGYTYSTTGAIVTLKLPVRMRGTPALSATPGDWILSDFVGDANHDVSGLAVDATSTPDTAVLDCTSSGMTAGRNVLLRGDGGGTRTLILDKEL